MLITSGRRLLFNENPEFKWMNKFITLVTSLLNDPVSNS